MNHSPSNYPAASRVERLLRERELKRFNRVQLDDDSDDSDDAALLVPPPSAAVSLPRKQRLLVVANRLPVSAVRRGEDSWSLDISAGGLVSALLGEKKGLTLPHNL